jgi:Tfp pilus assembly protein PilN
MVKISHWLARILCILAILFISLFALDSFEPGMPLWKQLVGFLIHLIPSFVLVIFLIVAWKWEQIGGMMFIILGLGLLPFIYNMNYTMNQSVWTSLGVVLVVNFPFVVIGLLFILSHFLKKKNINP